MNPAQPLALVLAALVLPIAAAYLHRRRRRTAVVSSVILFRAIAGTGVATRRSWSQLRPLLSLVLVVLALAALVLSLADPRDAGQVPRDTIVVLDTSASMGADGRLDAARAVLARIIERMRPGDRVALVSSGADTAVQIGLTEDTARVRELARALVPAGSSERMPAALRIADALARAHDAEVVLVSDGVGVTIPPLARPPVYVRVGRPGPNLGIHTLVVREADALGLAEVFVGLVAAAGERREVDVQLEVDGSIVDVVPLELPPVGEVQHLHRLALPDGERLTARILASGEDVLAADDVVSVPRRVGGRVRVLLVAGTRLTFLAEALRLHPRVDLTVVGPDDAVSPGAPFDLLVLDVPYHAAPPPHRHRLALGIAPEAVGLTLREQVPVPEIVRWSFEDPLFRFVDLSALVLQRGFLVNVDDDVRSLIDSDRGSLAVSYVHDDHPSLYLGWNPVESDLVLRVGFVNFVANVVEWASPSADPTASSPAEDGPLPASESVLTPARELPGTRTAGEHDAGGPAPRPYWLLLALAALVLLTAETSIVGIRTFARTGTLAARTYTSSLRTRVVWPWPLPRRRTRP